VIKNCMNCGAVLINKKCEYCGTEYNERFSVDLSDDFRGTLTFKGKTYDVYMSEVEVENECMSYRGADGRIMLVKGNVNRTFTLIGY